MTLSSPLRRTLTPLINKLAFRFASLPPVYNKYGNASYPLTTDIFMSKGILKSFFPYSGQVFPRFEI